MKTVFASFLIYALCVFAGEYLSGPVGIPHAFGALFSLLFCGFFLLFAFIFKKTGALYLKPARGKHAHLFALPLPVLVAINLFFCFLDAGAPAIDPYFSLRILFAALAEELLFRGLLFSELKTKCKPYRAALLTSFLFCILHAANLLGGADVLETLIQIPLAFAVSFAFCAYVHKFRSLLIPIFVHVLINASSLICAFHADPIRLILIGSAVVFYFCYGLFMFHLSTRRTNDL